MGNNDIENELSLFQSKHDLIIPDDVKDYFRTFNAKDYDLDMFAFYGLDEFKSVKDEVGDYGGVPNYTNIVNVLPAHQNCFVFAEYFTHLLVYAIRLYENESEKNEVYVICGDTFNVVANSFTEFLQIYFKEEWERIFI